MTKTFFLFSEIRFQRIFIRKISETSKNLHLCHFYSWIHDVPGLDLSQYLCSQLDILNRTQETETCGHCPWHHSSLLNVQSSVWRNSHGQDYFFILQYLMTEFPRISSSCASSSSCWSVSSLCTGPGISTSSSHQPKHHSPAAQRTLSWG